MDHTLLLNLPLIMPAQAQKHVTHNEALQALETYIQISVEGHNINTPPSNPINGTRICIGDNPSGAWAGREGQIALYRDNLWEYTIPQNGWTAFDLTQNNSIVFMDNVWSPPTFNETNLRLEGLGINADSDENNAFILSANASLFSNNGTGHQLKINKATQTDTASLVFQSGYTGHAEIGLVGDNNFNLKVNTDNGWQSALHIDRATGQVTFPTGNIREVLSQPRTYFVAPSGNNSQSGLTQQDAFSTLQHAITTALSIDPAGHTVTIQMADGTYTTSATLSRPLFDGGLLHLYGNPANPSAVHLDTNNQTALTIDNPGASVRIEGIKFTGLIGLWVRYGALVYLRGSNEFGTCPARQIGADNGAYIEIIGTLKISGDSATCLYPSSGGHILITGSNIEIIESPNFSTAFIVAQTLGIGSIYNNSFSGSATGVRYHSSGNSIIDTQNAGANALPGNAAGTAITGGIYV